ncbi:hypothetical protein Sjap_010632 [Stephania japonica]|uniref:Selenoprotein H n=1 Tax=Stephania japonica TaxID=461633 RepID=A0AAP0JAU0_9MAGN
MAPKRKEREPGEAKKVGKVRKARTATGSSSEQPRAAASTTRRATRRSNPVLVESPLEALPDIPRRKKGRKTAQVKGKSVPAKVNDASTGDLTTEATRKIIIEFCSFGVYCGIHVKMMFWKTWPLAVRSVFMAHVGGSKQCNSFKTRAMQVKAGLEAGLSGIEVVLNPEKPRLGCFEIREDEGDTLFTLLDMKRPFKDLKAVNIDELVSDILKKLK